MCPDFSPATCRRFLNPLLPTTAFFGCCRMRRQFSICIDRHSGACPRGWKLSSANGPCGTWSTAPENFGYAAIRVAVAAQFDGRGSVKQACHARRLAELLKKIERGGHDGD